jgi:hypothetical protein
MMGKVMNYRPSQQEISWIAYRDSAKKQVVTNERT